MENQSKITNVAFKKTKKAVLEVMMKSKLHVAAQYIVNQANAEINARQVQSILYYAQILSLVFLGEEIFEEDAQITYNQMPYLSLYEGMKKQGLRMIDMNLDKLNRSEKEIIDCVQAACGWYGHRALLAISTVEKKVTEEQLDGLNSKVLTKDYLKNVYGKMFSQLQIKRYQEFPRYLQQRLLQAVGKDALLSLNVHSSLS